jgi:hypothetical protein
VGPQGPSKIFILLTQTGDNTMLDKILITAAVAATRVIVGKLGK